MPSTYICQTGWDQPNSHCVQSNKNKYSPPCAHCTVYNPMIAAQGDLHCFNLLETWPTRFAIEHELLLGSANGQDTRLGRIDNRCELAH